MTMHNCSQCGKTHDSGESCARTVALLGSELAIPAGCHRETCPTCNGRGVVLERDKQPRPPDPLCGRVMGSGKVCGHPMSHHAWRDATWSTTGPCYHGNRRDDDGDRIEEPLCLCSGFVAPEPVIPARAWDCPDCGHRHEGRRFAGICIGCPCPRTAPVSVQTERDAVARGEQVLARRIRKPGELPSAAEPVRTCATCRHFGGTPDASGPCTLCSASSPRNLAPAAPGCDRWAARESEASHE